MSKKSGARKSMPKVSQPGKPSKNSMLTGKNTHKKPKTY